MKASGLFSFNPLIMKHSIVTVILLALFLAGHCQQTVGLFHTSDSVYNGYVLFGPARTETTYLIDNCGDLQYTWNSAYRAGGSVQLLENGQLIRSCVFDNGSPISAGGAGGRLEAIRPDQLLAWELNLSNDSIRQHHDFEPLPNGNILTIIWELKSEAEAIAMGRDTAIIGGSGLWPEYIIEYDPDNDTIVWEWHAWDHIVQDRDSTKPNYGLVSDHPELFDLNYTSNGSHPDWQHFNSIAYNATLDQILLSSPFFNEIYIIDHSTTTAEAAGHTGGASGMGGDILWRWGNPQAYGVGDSTDQRLFFQHDAHWIPAGSPDAGNIIVFNNGRNRTPVEHSSVDILNPVELGSYQIGSSGSFLPDTAFYSYSSPGLTDFYSRIISSASQLPNGNIIIDEGNQGHFFEIDSMGNVVWDYVNPVVEDSILSQEDTIPGNTNALHNMCFRARRYDTTFAGLAFLPLVNQGPIELDPYPSMCAVSVNEIPDWEYQVYPNPVTETLKISSQESINPRANYQIVDQLGRVVLSDFIGSGSVNVSRLTPGIYTLSLTIPDLDGRFSKRFIKN